MLRQHLNRLESNYGFRADPVNKIENKLVNFKINTLFEF